MNEKNVSVQYSVYLPNRFWDGSVTLPKKHSNYKKLKSDITLSCLDNKDFLSKLRTFINGKVDVNIKTKLSSYGVITYEYNEDSADFKKYPGYIPYGIDVAYETISFLKIISRINLYGIAETAEVNGKILWSRIGAEPINFYDHKSHPFNHNNLLEAKRVQEYFSNYSNLKNENICFRRFHSALSESNPYDRLIEFIVALESLFNDGGGEITYKIALRSAYFIGQNSVERKFIYEMIRDAYKHRSYILHGGNLGFRAKKKGNEAYTFCCDKNHFLEEIVQRALIFILKKGAFPKSKELDNKIIDGEASLPLSEEEMRFFFFDLSKVNLR
ncbi:MAG: hypothetical protein WC304_00445 [Candidatus Gracilibacteria bacterium]|jgi:hypothetical protein